jgi:hypothetical protein
MSPAWSCVSKNLVIENCLQEFIFAADGAEDYQRHCDLSGEPLIQLEHFTTPESQHLYAMETPPLNKIVVKGRGPQSAYQVSSELLNPKHGLKLQVDMATPQGEA